MLDCLHQIKNEKWDCLSFFEDPDNEERLFIHGSRYKNEANYHIGSNDIQIYHIVLVKDHEEKEELFDHFDSFEAGLSDPLEYVSNLIPQGWYGIVAKKTDTSHKYVDDMVDKLKKFL